MVNMPVIQSYRDLRVWQLSMEQAESAYRATASWPKEEMFGLTSQVRRSAASIPANIAEGFGRESAGSLAHFLRNAQGSLKEFETHVLLASRVGLLEQAALDQILAKADDVGRMLGSLIRKVANKASPRPTTNDRRATLDEVAS